MGHSEMAVNGKPTGKRLETDLTDYAKRRGTEGPYADNLDIDVIIVGGGFGKYNIIICKSTMVPNSPN